MTDTTNRSRVQAGVPTGGEFAAEAKGENDDLLPDDYDVSLDLLEECYENLTTDADGWSEFSAKDNLEETLGRLEHYFEVKGVDLNEVRRKIRLAWLPRDEMTPMQAVVDCMDRQTTVIDSSGRAKSATVTRWTAETAEDNLAETTRHLGRFIDYLNSVPKPPVLPPARPLQASATRSDDEIAVRDFGPVRGLDIGAVINALDPETRAKIEDQVDGRLSKRLGSFAWEPPFPLTKKARDLGVIGKKDYLTSVNLIELKEWFKKERGA